MSVLTTTPKLLYPHSRQYPFDEVSEKIVKALEKRNWDVPGIVVEFHTYGSGEAKYLKAHFIKGESFQLYFCRVQGRLNDVWNDTAALHSIYIPKQGIDVFSDNSGPNFYLYVGNDWKNDKEWFMNSTKVHAKLHKEPRRYLKYKGDGFRFNNVCIKETQNLIFDSDLDRQYSPEGDEAISFNLAKKLKEITEWLEKNVLDYILTFPESDEIQPPIPEMVLIPYEGPWPNVFSVCDWRQAERICKGKEDQKLLKPEERYAYSGNGCRLVPLNVPCEGRFPEIAYEGFQWCDVNQNINKESREENIADCAQQLLRFDDAKFIVSIKPKYANDVYVIDYSLFDKTRNQIFTEISPRDRLTDEELNDVYAALGATIVPITEYKGGYEEPIVLINRELDFDEVEWVSIMK